MRFFHLPARIAAFFICGLPLLLGACAGKQAIVPPEPSYIAGALVLPDGSPAAQGDFLDRAEGASYILLGERHDNPVDHKVQASLLETLATRGKRPLLGLEMLPRKRYDDILLRFGNGGISLEELPEALDWQRVWGFDYSLYRPIFAAALQHSVPVYGLNIPHEIRRAVSKKGLDKLTAGEKRELPRKIVPPLPEQRDKLASFYRFHGAMMSGAQAKGGNEPPGTGPTPAGTPPRGGLAPVSTEASPGEQGLERFLLIQSLWDSTMAEQAALIVKNDAGPKPGRPMVIIAGSGHVEHGYGIASRLKEFDPAGRSLLVMPFSGNRPEPGAADIYYYSPPAPGGAPGEGRPAGQRLGLALLPVRGKLQIVSVEPGSRAERAGLMAGDILERAGSFPVAAAFDLHKAAQEAREQDRPMSVAVQRQGKFLAFFLPDAE